MRDPIKLVKSLEASMSDKSLQGFSHALHAPKLDW